jgi:hypothetical protein
MQGKLPTNFILGSRDAADHDTAIEDTNTKITAMVAQFLRLLGLMQENQITDNTGHDAQDRLTSSRVRLFDSKANVPGTPDGSETTGLIATYTMTATYEAGGGDKMESFSMVLEP